MRKACGRYTGRIMVCVSMQEENKWTQKTSIALTQIYSLQ